jgi:DNA-binding response OmpR family regulator
LAATGGPAQELKYPAPMSRAGSLLIVDDELQAADVVRDFLEEQGYAVTCASNGRDALVLASLARPDAVLLDIRMPERDGPEVLCDLVALDSSIPVVLVSGPDDEELACALLKAGAFDYVRKPFVLDNLQEVVGLAVRVGRRKPVPDETTPWQCEPRTGADGTPSVDGDAWCGHCHEPVGEGDTAAVRERNGFYHAACWLSRITAHAADAQLTPR